ncbi:MAG: amino acid adenylation domain-containing protein, partial [Gammaproteobacteria bacterium]|nr:amino acid adenylation domain-containing protein [Gammaproteobacteria bacterium]
GELDRASNRLARRLRRLGVGPDRRVGIAAERSFELVVGLLAVLKAGGAYVPFDPDYPTERLAYLFEDAAVDLILSQDGVRDRLPGDSGPLRLDLDDPTLTDESEEPPEVEVHPEQLAYVIYTSGSTGRPKGAGNTHAALANRLHWMQEAYRLGADDTVLQKTPFSFDVSVWEFFWPLMVGARLAIAEPGDHRDPARLSTLIRAYGVTTLHFVPSMLQEFVGSDDCNAYPSLRRVVCSGEALSAELRDRTLQRLPGIDLHNLYGPTEAAIDVTHWTCRADDGGRVPIGFPIANTAIHLLDGDLNPLPPGVIGELFIAGAGLARGYHGRPGLTAERFVPDPFSAGGRLYRTGDLASRRRDGTLDYLGRVDHQVKLRGFRIELGEIEAQLLAQLGVREAVAALREGPGGARLLAYVTGDDRMLAPEALREALRATLPDYMVPERIILLAEIPRTHSGKLDRRALPEPDWTGGDYQAPETPTEQELARIWGELLGVARVGRTDSFFALGGHSLLAAQLVARIRRQFNVALPLRTVFETGSLTALASELEMFQPQPTGDAALSAIDSLLGELEAS